MGMGMGMVSIIRRFVSHLLWSPLRVRRTFSAATLTAIADAIRATERDHDGEIRFALEAALDPLALLRGLTPRDRALEVFSQLRVWDTEENKGVLIYVLLADHAVEIVADRGARAATPGDTWNAICRQIESDFACGRYRSGAQTGIEAVARALGQPLVNRVPGHNELPDEPVVLT